MFFVHEVEMVWVAICFLLFDLVLASPDVLDVDWREFISRSDPLWVFNTSKPETVPTMWFDSPFHGNGNLGMLILAERVQRNGQEKYILRFDVGRADVWDVRMKGSKYAVGDR